MARSRQDENQPVPAPAPESLYTAEEPLDERVTLVMVEFDREHEAEAVREVTPVVAELDEGPASPALSALALLQRMLGPEEHTPEPPPASAPVAALAAPSQNAGQTQILDEERPGEALAPNGAVLVVLQNGPSLEVGVAPPAFNQEQQEPALLPSGAGDDSAGPEEGRQVPADPRVLAEDNQAYPSPPPAPPEVEEPGPETAEAGPPASLHPAEIRVDVPLPEPEMSEEAVAEDAQSPTPAVLLDAELPSDVPATGIQAEPPLQPKTALEELFFAPPLAESGEETVDQEEKAQESADLVVEAESRPETDIEVEAHLQETSGAEEPVAAGAPPLVSDAEMPVPAPVVDMAPELSLPVEANVEASFVALAEDDSPPVTPAPEATDLPAELEEKPEESSDWMEPDEDTQEVALPKPAGRALEEPAPIRTDREGLLEQKEEPEESVEQMEATAGAGLVDTAGDTAPSAGAETAYAVPEAPVPPPLLPDEDPPAHPPAMDLPAERPRPVEAEVEPQLVAPPVDADLQDRPSTEAADETLHEDRQESADLLEPDEDTQEVPVPRPAGTATEAPPLHPGEEAADRPAIGIVDGVPVPTEAVLEDRFMEAGMDEAPQQPARHRTENEETVEQEEKPEETAELAETVKVPSLVDVEAEAPRQVSSTSRESSAPELSAPVPASLQDVDSYDITPILEVLEEVTTQTDSPLDEVFFAPTIDVDQPLPPQAEGGDEPVEREEEPEKSIDPTEPEEDTQALPVSPPGPMAEPDPLPNVVAVDTVALSLKMDEEASETPASDMAEVLPLRPEPGLEEAFLEPPVEAPLHDLQEASAAAEAPVPPLLLDEDLSESEPAVDVAPEISDLVDPLSEEAFFAPTMGEDGPLAHEALEKAGELEEDSEEPLDPLEPEEAEQTSPLPSPKSFEESPTVPELQESSTGEEASGLEEEPAGTEDMTTPRISWWVAEDLPLDQGEEPPPPAEEPEPSPAIEPEAEDLPLEESEPLVVMAEPVLWTEDLPSAEPLPVPLPAPAAPVALAWDLAEELAAPVEEPPQPNWDLPDWEDV